MIVQNENLDVVVASNLQTINCVIPIDEDKTKGAEETDNTEKDLDLKIQLEEPKSSTDKAKRKQ